MSSNKLYSQIVSLRSKIKTKKKQIEQVDRKIALHATSYQNEDGDIDIEGAGDLFDERQALFCAQTELEEELKELLEEQEKSFEVI